MNSANKGAGQTIHSAPFLLPLLPWLGLWSLHSICGFSKGNRRQNNRRASAFVSKIKWKPCDWLGCFTLEWSPALLWAQGCTQLSASNIFWTNGQYGHKRETGGVYSKGKGKTPSPSQGEQWYHVLSACLYLNLRTTLLPPEQFHKSLYTHMEIIQPSNISRNISQVSEVILAA